MKEILIALMIWIGANTDYNTNVPLPSIEFKTQVEMENLYYGDRSEKEGDLYGFYNLKKNIIILPDTWDSTKPFDLGLLVHEIIHYLQDINDVQFGCTAEMELDAWPLQKQYLANVHSYHWEYDGLWHLMISQCSPNDEFWTN